MHKEHLYEYLYFIRQNLRLLHDIELIAQELINEELLKRQSMLIKKLIEIRDLFEFCKCNFFKRKINLLDQYWL